MSKTAKSTETVEFPSFDASKATDQVRAFAEKGVEQSKEVYAKMKAGAEDAQKAMESSFEKAKTVGSELSLKTIAAISANSEAGFSHVEALLGASTLAEVAELQTAFFRKSFERTVEQAREIQAIATKAAEEVAQPIKAAIEKSVQELKAA